MTGRWILETERLLLRELVLADRSALCQILQDPLVMYAYEHAFSDHEVLEWLERQRIRYQKDGFGLWAVILKKTGQLIGQCGITLQTWGNHQVPEIGYLFQRSCWHRGYATEAAVGCRQYAFETLGFPEVFSIIRDTNTASMAVAERHGMSICGYLIKHYYGMEMPHLVYSVKQPACAQNQV